MATKKVIVQKRTEIRFKDKAQPYIEPPQYFSALHVNDEYYSGGIETIRNTITQTSRTTVIQVVSENFYLRFGFGSWRIYGYDRDTRKYLYAWDESERPAWLNASGSDRILSLSYPLRVPVEVEIPDDGQDAEHIAREEEKTVGTTVTVWIFRKGENYTPPPFPYDPNQPPPFPPTEGDLKLWCKVGGTVHRAKKLYIKQNGVIVPVKKILGR